MANFTNLDKSILSVADMCVSNNSKADLAQFVMQQYQATFVNASDAKAKEAAEKKSNNGQSGSTSKRQAALDRLKAHMN